MASRGRGRGGAPRDEFALSGVVTLSSDQFSRGISDVRSELNDLRQTSQVTTQASQAEFDEIGDRLRDLPGPIQLVVDGFSRLRQVVASAAVGFAGLSSQQLQMSTFLSSVRQAITSLTVLGATATATAALVGAAVIGVANSAGVFAKEIKSLQNSLAITSAEAQALSFAFRGVELETVDAADALNTLADRAQDAVDGATSMIDDFGLVGVSVDQLRNKKPHEIWEIYADAVARTENPTRRQASLVRILGDDLGRKLLPVLQSGAQGIRDLQKELQSDKLILPPGAIKASADAANAWGDAKTAIVDAGRQIGTAFAPALQSAADGLRDFAGRLDLFNRTRAAIDATRVSSLRLKNTISLIPAFFIDALRVVPTGIKEFIQIPALKASAAVNKAFANVLDDAFRPAQLLIKEYIELPFAKAVLTMRKSLAGFGKATAAEIFAAADEVRALRKEIEFLNSEAARDVEPGALSEEMREQQDLLAKLQGEVARTKDVWKITGSAIENANADAKRSVEELFETIRREREEMLSEEEIGTALTDVPTTLPEIELPPMEIPPLEMPPLVLTKAEKGLIDFRNTIHTTLSGSIETALTGDFENIGDLWKQLLTRMAADAIAADIGRAFNLGPATSQGADAASQGESFFGQALGFIGSFFGGGSTSSTAPVATTVNINTPNAGSFLDSSGALKNRIGGILS